jgi:electron transfer flavoprotein beta subunit
MLAECLDLPQVNLVVATEISGANLKVKQELEGGWFQYVTTTMPALLAIQSGINKPRYASLKGIMAMKRKEIKVLSAADLGLPSEEFTPGRVLQRVYFPSKTKETVFIEGSMDEMVTQLLDKLTHDAKVLV